jgi:uncharacterized protein YbcV (DUF1398 family)
MNTDTIAECMKLSFADTPFPQVVARLAGAGVRSYTADLVQLHKTYYGGDSDNAQEPMPLGAGPRIADRFDKETVADTVHAIQKREIGYAEFLRRIMAAGCASYSVFIDGRKAVYVGRDGDFYIEPFPQAK